MKSFYFIVPRFLTMLGCLLVFEANGQSAGFPFTENKGQWHHSVTHRLQMPGGNVYLQQSGWAYVVYRYETEDAIASRQLAHHAVHTRPVGGHVVRLHLLNTLAGAALTGEQPSAFRSHFLLGNDPAQWGTHAASYAAVVQKEVYPQTDLRFYTQDGHMKYDWLLAAGADPRQIKWRYEGHEALFLRSGHLVMATSAGEIIEHKPLAYQYINGIQQSVECLFRLAENGEVSFAFPQGYRTDLPLVIDPELIFSTYSGSIADNWGFTATYDSAGNVFAGGIVFNDLKEFPVTPGAFQDAYQGGNSDVSILKYSPDGKTLLYATYLGGDGTDLPMTTVVNSKGELVILSLTSSGNFPVLATAFQAQFKGGPQVASIGGLPFENGSDLAISILSVGGNSLSASTYLGGSHSDGLNAFIDHQSVLDPKPLNANYGDEFRSDIAVDEQDHVYVVSQTHSVDFPVTANAFQPAFDSLQDVVIFKMPATLDRLEWSSFFGGKGYDAAYSLKLDASNNLFVCGGTQGNDLPMPGTGFHAQKQGGATDGYILQVSANGTSVLAGTYVGTDSLDQAHILDLDTQGNVYVFGQTFGSYPVTEGVYSEPKSGQFIHSFTPDLTQSRFSTIIGAGNERPDIVPTAFMVDDCGNLHLAGWGGAVNNGIGYLGGTTNGFSVTPDAFQAETDGSDFYLMSLSENAGEFLFGTFIGANGLADHVDGGTSRFSPDGTIYQSVCSCGNGSFPTTPGVWSNVNPSFLDADPAITRCNIATFKYNLERLNSNFVPSTRAGCPPLTVTFQNTSTGADRVVWNLGTGELFENLEELTFTFDVPGTYVVTLTAEGKFSCESDVFSDTVVVYTNDFSGVQVSPAQNSCKGDAVRLQASGGTAYQWRNLQSNEVIGTQAEITVTPLESASYAVRVFNQFGCSIEKETEVTVFPDVTLDFEAFITRPCGKAPELMVTNRSTQQATNKWSLNDGRFGTSDQYDISGYQFDTEGSFDLTLEVTNGECVKEETISVLVDRVFPPNVFTPSDRQYNQTLMMGNETSGWRLVIVNRWGEEVFRSNDYQGTWNGDGFPDGIFYYLLTSPDGSECRGWFQKM